jgi:hypothetical protein
MIDHLQVVSFGVSACFLQIYTGGRTHRQGNGHQIEVCRRVKRHNGGDLEPGVSRLTVIWSDLVRPLSLS